MNKNILVYMAILSRVFVRQENSFNEKELVEIYIAAFDSFIPEKGIDDRDYMAIYLENDIFDNISQESKKKIMSYFRNKYKIEVLNESEETLREKGYANKHGDIVYNGKKGILLGVQDIRIISKDKVEVDGYWIVSWIGGRGATTILNNKNGIWIVESRYWTWIS